MAAYFWQRGYEARSRHTLATTCGIFESMALLGKIEQYDPEQEEWPQYVERLEQFFEETQKRTRDGLLSSRSSDRRPTNC